MKGGNTGSSSGILGIRDAKSYRDWGKSLKYNPALIEFEVHLLYYLNILVMKLFQTLD